MKCKCGKSMVGGKCPGCGSKTAAGCKCVGKMTGQKKYPNLTTGKNKAE